MHVPAIAGQACRGEVGHYSRAELLARLAMLARTLGTLSKPTKTLLPVTAYLISSSRLFVDGQTFLRIVDRDFGFFYTRVWAASWFCVLYKRLVKTLPQPSCQRTSFRTALNVLEFVLAAEEGLPHGHAEEYAAINPCTHGTIWVLVWNPVGLPTGFVLVCALFVTGTSNGQLRT
jgi:hypothetical protein